MGLADPVRSRLPELMDKLHNSGIQTIMLTGDQSATARAVARQIRLSEGEPEVIDGAELDRLSAAELGLAAREVADVFFATEDLAALPMAIERGRATYENIRRAIHYVLSTNGSEIALMLAGTAVGMGEMLAPMQLLWINLVSDVLPAIGLALEPPDAGVMRQPPKQANERILTRDHVGR